jgi:hypothetical protein
MILIIGCGRSGTHWLAKILSESGQIKVTVELPGIFDRATKASMGDMNRIPELIHIYRREIDQSAKIGYKEYADKSHPALWFAEALLQEIPELRFIGIERSVYAKVASALKHGGMANLIRQWKIFPIPNRSLGITKDLVDKYNDLSIIQKLTMRWCEGHREMERLKPILADRLHFVKYEDLIQSPELERERLIKFLGLEVGEIRPKIESLDKWKSELSNLQISEIDGVLSKYSFV